MKKSFLLVCLLALNCQANTAILPSPSPVSTALSSPRLPDRIFPIGDPSEVTALAFSPDGHWLLTASTDGILSWIDRNTGIQEKTAADPSIENAKKTQIEHLHFNANGKLFVSVDSEDHVKVWDSESRKPRYDFTSERCSGAQFSQDGSLLLVGRSIPRDGAGSELDVYASDSGKKIRTFSTNWNSPWQFAATGDGQVIGTGGAGEDGDYTTTLVWDLKSGKILRQFDFFSTAISSDAKTLISTKHENDGIKLVISNSKDGKEIHRISTGLKSPPENIVLSPKGMFVALLERFTYQLFLWNVTEGKLVATIPGGKNARKSPLAFSADETLFAFKQFEHRTSIKIYNTSTGKEVRSIDGHAMMGGLALSPDGRTLVRGTGSFPGSLTIWDVSTGLGKIVDTDSGNNIEFSPDGKWLAEGFNFDRTIKVLETAEWKPVSVTSVFPTKPINSIAFAGNQEPPSSFQQSGLKWFQFGQAAAKQFVFGAVGPFSVSMDKKLAAVEANPGAGSISIWDITTGQKKRDLISKNIKYVANPIFSPSGDFLATMTLRFEEEHSSKLLATILLWNTQSWEERKLFETNEQWAGGIAFQPHGSLLAVRVSGTEIRLYDVTSRKVLETLRSPPLKQADHLVFSSDGQWLVSGTVSENMFWKMKSQATSAKKE